MNDKEQVLDIIFSYSPLDIKIRTISSLDSAEETYDKKKYPFYLNKAVDVTIKTTEREFTFNIPEGFRWNGADLPRFLWWLGSSRDNDYVIASLLHDYMLENKKKIFFEILEEDMYVDGYRRLTSLILGSTKTFAPSILSISLSHKSALSILLSGTPSVSPTANKIGVSLYLTERKSPTNTQSLYSGIIATLQAVMPERIKFLSSTNESSLLPNKLTISSITDRYFWSA